MLIYNVLYVVSSLLFFIIPCFIFSVIFNICVCTKLRKSTVNSQQDSLSERNADQTQPVYDTANSVRATDQKNSDLEMSENIAYGPLK